MLRNTPNIATSSINKPSNINSDKVTFMVNAKIKMMMKVQTWTNSLISQTWTLDFYDFGFVLLLLDSAAPISPILYKFYSIFYSID